MLRLSPRRGGGGDVVSGKTLGHAVALVSQELSEMPATQLENAESNGTKQRFRYQRR